jgi:hypothetical protein
MVPLIGHTGAWSGTNRFRLMPTDEPGTAPATATLTVSSAGTIAVLAYTWSHPDDGPQEGHLMLGPGEEPGSVVALWGDSWHQQPAVAVLRGGFLDDGVHVRYSYAEGWWWRIALTTPDASTLRLQMDNEVPSGAEQEGGPYWAMLADLHRG